MGKNHTPNTLSFGNTEKKARNSEVKQYCFTYNNYTVENVNKLKHTLNTLGKWIFGYEVGASGTPHLQGYINLNSKKTLQSLKNHIGIDAIHYEKCKGSQKQNVDYCSKEGNYESNFVPQPFIQEIEKLYDWQIDINNILNQEPDNRSLYYFFESEGCKGKTTYQKYVFTHFKKCIVLSGKGSDMKNGIVTYLDKNNELPQIVLINIPRESFDFVSWTGIEEVKDMFFYSGKYEGGMICGKCPHVLIFANEPPPIKKVSADRWKVFELIDNELKPWKPYIDNESI